MRLWRREALHERLAREGGLTRPAPRLPWHEVGIHGVHRLREWEALVLADAPAVRGELVEFVTLPDGTVVVEGDAAEDAVDELADAVEARVTPPYRARAVRQGDGRWAVAANPVEVVELPDAEGEEIELTVQGGERALLVDGQRAFGSLPALERAAGGADEYVARARRLDGPLWEVDVSPL